MTLSVKQNSNSSMKKKLAGVVILYNSDASLLQNISSYIAEVDVLYAIDNSISKNQDLISALKSIPKISYLKMPTNIGIASALNIACEQAITDGFDWLLTMDQDSSASKAMVQRLYSYAKSNNNIAIISPYHASKFISEPETGDNVSEVTTVMTSGNLLNLQLYQTIGPFTEELFIDFVDHDYCLRAHQHNYKVLQVNSAILEHNLGDLQQHKFFNSIFYSTNHPPIRKHYIFRNRAYIIQKYKDDFPVFCRRELRRFMTDIFIVIFFEKQKTTKLRMMYTGVRDFFHNKMGIYRA